MKYQIATLIYLFLGFLIPSLSVQAQDLNFTQYFNAPAYYNPASTGLNPGLTIRSVFRNQLPKPLFGYRSFFFSADLGERNLPGFGGIGIIAASDNIGDGLMRNLSLGLNLSARIRFSGLVALQIGVRASVVQKYIDWEGMGFSDQLGYLYGNIYPGAFTPPESDKKVCPDFGTGLVLQFASKNTRVSGNVGFAIDHLFTPDQSFFPDYATPLPRKMVAHADFTFALGQTRTFERAPKGIGDPFKLIPGILFQNQDKLNQLEAGLNIQKFNFTLGGWYKTMFDSPKSTEIAVMAGYRFLFAKEVTIHIMYSHDFRLTHNEYGPGEPNEISLAFGFGTLQVFGKRGEKSDK